MDRVSRSTRDTNWRASRNFDSGSRSLLNLNLHSDLMNLMTLNVNFDLNCITVSTFDWELQRKLDGPYRKATCRDQRKLLLRRFPILLPSLFCLKLLLFSYST